MAGAKQQPAQKKIPMRQCMGCSEHFPKKELLRVVLTPEGEVLLDFTGKKSGRGAYICKSVKCLQRARKSKRIAGALKCEIPEAVYDRLEAELTENE